MKTPAVTSAAGRLSEGYAFRDWTLKGLLQYIIGGSDQSALESVTDQLGPPTAHLDCDGVAWCCWENKDYILYISEDSTLIDVDVTARGMESALKALQWDLRMTDNVLSRAESGALFAQGRAKGKEHRIDLPSKSLADLKQFVRDYCDGAIYCDFQVRDPHLLRMVFMPLALGAFSFYPREGEVPSAVYLAEQALIVEHALRTNFGPEPKPPAIPETPVRPPDPPEPPPPEGYRQSNPEEITVMKDDIAWGVTPPEKLETYLEVIRLHNVGVDYHHAEARMAWEAQKQALDRDHEKALAGHQEVVRAFDEQQEHYKAAHLGWLRCKAQEDALLAGFRAGYLDNLAVIYEYHSQAGPRSINGCPIFYSFRMLNKSDWERACKAITRELEHRANMEI